MCAEPTPPPRATGRATGRRTVGTAHPPCTCPQRAQPPPHHTPSPATPPQPHT